CCYTTHISVDASTSISSFTLSRGGTKFTNFFICNERGHLSKSCPQNTHGIYPKMLLIHVFSNPAISLIWKKIVLAKATKILLRWLMLATH
ncbi:DNA-binding protein HEXBP isoform X1, partial [Fagus crenata]